MKNQSCLDSLLNQRKGPCFSKVSIQSLCSIKERVHIIQRYQFSLFAQSKKGSMLFKEFYINKDGCVFNVTFQKKILHLCLKTSSFFISSISFFCAIRSMFLNEIWLDLWICASYNGSMKTYFIRWAYENVLLTSGLLKRTSYAGFIGTFFLRLF